MLAENDRIKTKEQLKEFIKVETAKYGSTSKIAIFMGIREKDILSKHNILLRKTEYHINNGHKIRGIVYKIRLAKLQNKYALHIPVNCCDIGFKIMHVGPVLINGNATLGKNVSIHINTGIVANGVTSLVPTLGDNIVVGIGSVILGGITIANNVAIGANAVVNKSITDENIAVAGVPAKKISDNGQNKWGV